MGFFDAQVAALAWHLETAPLARDLRAAYGEAADLDLWRAVLDEAGRLSEDVIQPIDAIIDHHAAMPVDGHVRCAATHHAAWQAFRNGGWLSLDAPQAVGGQGLPLTLLVACDELANRGSAPFMMMPTAIRSAGAVLIDLDDERLVQEWLEPMLRGQIAATICISEPDAGSDVGRIRTVGRRDEHGEWRVSGEKCWISFGDHDLTDRIVHFLLARTNDQPGVRGLSLFLVPNRHADDTPNGVSLRRVEEKMGLHGSPTCALGFEGAQAVLLGAEGRGLQHLFRMMLLMRLSCGPQGCGVATDALEVAARYAEERRQGGDARQPPVAIARHADIRRQLATMAGAVEVARGLNLTAAAALELSRLHADEVERARYLALAQWLLPLVKDGGATLAFDVSSMAMQVLGGAGYTSEWPIERHLRDSRVFAIFEGTTGIQAIDLVERRLIREQGEGLSIFLALARATQGPAGRPLFMVLDELEAASRHLVSAGHAEVGWAATAYLRLATCAAHSWIADAILLSTDAPPTPPSVSAAARAYLMDAPARAQLEAARIMAEPIQDLAAC